MYEYNTKGKEIMIIFYDPECTHCADILDMIAGSQRVVESINEGELAVLAVYAEGKKDVWEKTKRDLPENWIVGYDMTGILENEMYDLPAMPTIIYIG